MSITSKPLVSIVMPIYNRAGFIESAIDSVLEQDYEPLEIIAIDDGSTDETSDVLARIADRDSSGRLTCLRHDNIGQAATINRGLALAKGTFLGYLNSDDYYYPGMISTLVAAAMEHPEAEVIYPWCRIVDVAGNVIDTVEDVPHTFVDALRWAFCAPGVGAIIQRRLYERIGGWNPRFKYTPDFDWWYRARDALFLPIREPLAAFRVHDGQISGARTLEMVRERIAILDEIYATDGLPAEAMAVHDEAYSALLIFCGAILHSSDDEERPSRFVVEDRLWRSYSRRARTDMADSFLRTSEALQAANRQVVSQQVVIDELNATINALEAIANQQRNMVEELSAKARQYESLDSESHAPSRLEEGARKWRHRLKSGWAQGAEAPQ